MIPDSCMLCKYSVKCREMRGQFKCVYLEEQSE